MANFILQSTININNFNVKIYSIDNETVDTNGLNLSLEDIMTLNYPSQVVEKLQNINGVSKIEIYNENNELLLTSEKFIP